MHLIVLGCLNSVLIFMLGKWKTLLMGKCVTFGALITYHMINQPLWVAKICLGGLLFHISQPTFVRSLWNALSISSILWSKHHNVPSMNRNAHFTLITAHFGIVKPLFYTLALLIDSVLWDAHQVNFLPCLVLSKQMAFRVDQLKKTILL